MPTATESTGIIETLSDALWRDERVFSARERELLASVLQHARRNGGDAAENEAVARTIATAVGEAIAQRIVEGIGGEITPRLLAEYGSRAGVAGPGPRPPNQAAGPGPHPGPNPTAGPGPHPGPRPPKATGGPGPHPGPNPSRPTGGPGPRKGGPGPRHGGPGPRHGGPGPRSGHGPGPHPGPAPNRASGYDAIATPSTPATTMGDLPVLVLDEFLAPQELQRLAQYVEARENEFVLSEVIAPGMNAGAVDFEHRKSRVLYDLGEHEAVLSGRILSYLPRILPAIGVEAFPIARVEAQITASNDGDFFRPHEDNGEAALQTRELTFVYFFHREPKAFRGGELRIYDSQPADNAEKSAGSGYRAIVPQQNQIVFFPSHLLHEITPVDCPTRAFLASRFTLNGWFHRPE